MSPVDYDSVAPTFDQRYARNDYSGVERALTSFIGADDALSVVEVGCGTGHWLERIAGFGRMIVGVDRSWQMLQRARSIAPSARFVHATAEQLPLESRSFDRAFCVNALHHFGDQSKFLHECRRVLRPDGTFLTIGLDPHTGTDRWWIYDYFPAALTADRRRYPATSRIRAMLLEAGFTSPRSEVVQHLAVERPFEWMLSQGSFERHSTSQLMVISDTEYESGMRRLAEERPLLRADLQLFGTYARVSS